MKRFALVLPLLLIGCGTQPMAKVAEHQPGRFRLMSAIEQADAGVMAGTSYVDVMAICDSANGNLLYVMAGANGRGGVAVVVGGCK